MRGLFSAVSMIMISKWWHDHSCRGFSIIMFSSPRLTGLFVVVVVVVVVVGVVKVKVSSVGWCCGARNGAFWSQVKALAAVANWSVKSPLFASSRCTPTTGV